MRRVFKIICAALVLVIGLSLAAPAQTNYPPPPPPDQNQQNQSPPPAETLPAPPPPPTNYPTAPWYPTFSKPADNFYEPQQIPAPSGATRGEGLPGNAMPSGPRANPNVNTSVNMPIVTTGPYTDMLNKLYATRMAEYNTINPYFQATWTAISSICYRDYVDQIVALRDVAAHTNELNWAAATADENSGWLAYFDTRLHFDAWQEDQARYLVRHLYTAVHSISGQYALQYSAIYAEAMQPRVATEPETMPSTETPPPEITTPTTPTKKVHVHGTQTQPSKKFIRNKDIK